MESNKLVYKKPVQIIGWEWENEKTKQVIIIDLKIYHIIEKGLFAVLIDKETYLFKNSGRSCVFKESKLQTKIEIPSKSN